MNSLDEAKPYPLVKIKVGYNAELPKYAKPGDACFDLVASSHGRFVYTENGSLDYIEYETNIAMEIPPGWKGIVYPRSSISKTCLMLANGVGVIDSGYRDTIKARFRIVGQFDPSRIYSIGDRIIQMEIVPVPLVHFEKVDELSTSERGKGGFGSSGR